MSEYYYDRPTYAEVVGEAPPRGLSFTPGIDYDPHDTDDVASVKLAMEIDMADRAQALASENTRLQAYIADLEQRLGDLDRPTRGIGAPITPHWHYWAGMPGYLPHLGPEFAGWDADEAIDTLIADLERQCQCEGEDLDELCEACLAVEVAKSARADRDHTRGFGVGLFHEIHEVAPAPTDCTCYQDEGGE